MNTYFQRLTGLFLTYFRVAAFTLGGGMVMLPLLEDEFVRKRGWLSSGDFMGVVTLINTLPGVIAINSSLIIGRKVAGFPGAIAAFLGGILPSVLIILLLAPLVAVIRNAPIAAAAFTAVRSAVAALILLLIIRQGRKMNLGIRELIFAVLALMAVRIAGVHPILVIPFAGIAGMLVYGRDERDSDIDGGPSK
jgi:chromate transporter